MTIQGRGLGDDATSSDSSSVSDVFSSLISPVSGSVATALTPQLKSIVTAATPAIRDVLITDVLPKFTVAFVLAMVAGAVSAAAIGSYFATRSEGRRRVYANQPFLPVRRRRRRVA